MAMCGRTGVEPKRTAHTALRTGEYWWCTGKLFGMSRLPGVCAGRRRGELPEAMATVRQRFVCRFVIAAGIAAGLVAVTSADRASGTLAVSVTVVRSCAVATSALTSGSALLDLKCPAGVTSGIRASGAVDVAPAAPGVRRLQVPTTESGGPGSRPDVRVVTVNF